MPFTRERDAFRQVAGTFKARPAVEEAYLDAVADVVERYNTSIYENRFTVGGAVELITLLLMRECGISAQPAGQESRGIDVHLGGAAGLSIKSQFAPSPGAFNLVNTRGGSAARWEVGTLFIIANKGVGYADSELLPNATRIASDALVLDWSPLRDFWEQHPQYLYSADIPVKPATILSGQSLVASQAVALEVLNRLDSPLLKHL
jgi:hypothetical protein